MAVTALILTKILFGPQLFREQLYRFSWNSEEKRGC